MVCGFFKEPSASIDSFILVRLNGLTNKVKGQTNSVLGSSSNQRLSEQRVNAVQDFLITNGISSSRLVVKGFREDKPIAYNKTRNGRKK